MCQIPPFDVIDCLAQLLRRPVFATNCYGHERTLQWNDMLQLLSMKFQMKSYIEVKLSTVTIAANPLRYADERTTSFIGG